MWSVRADPGGSAAQAGVFRVCSEVTREVWGERTSIHAFSVQHETQRVITSAAPGSRSLSEENWKVVAFQESSLASFGWRPEHTEAVAKVPVAPQTNLSWAWL